MQIKISITTKLHHDKIAPENPRVMAVAWTLTFDGGSRSPQGQGRGISGVGWCLYHNATLHDAEAHYMGENHTNNESEYTGITRGVQAACPLMAKTDSLTIMGDSKLVVEHLNGRWRVKSETLQPYFDRAKAALGKLPCEYTLSWIPRKQNAAADRMSNIAMDTLDTLRGKEHLR